MKNSEIEDHNNPYKKKSKTPKKPIKSGFKEFTIKLIVDKNKEKSFDIYQQHSSEEAATKMWSNLRLGDEMIMYFSAYIKEKRLELLSLPDSDSSPNPGKDSLLLNLSR